MPLSTAALALATTAPASGATALLYSQVNATGACQAALSVYEGQIRKRPLALQNEGTIAAFVTCSPASVQNATVDLAGYQLIVANRSGVALTLSCTAVIGGDLWGPAPVYITKSLVVATDSVGTFRWGGDEFVNFRPFNFSCSIPPGVGLGSLFILQLLVSN